MLAGWFLQQGPEAVVDNQVLWNPGHVYRHLAKAGPHHDASMSGGAGTRALDEAVTASNQKHSRARKPHTDG
jgi:hypothetical protein